MKLSKYQQALINALQDNNDTVISIPDGCGKTYITCEAILRKGYKTVLVVTNKCVEKQWAHQAGKYLPQSVKISVVSRHKLASCVSEFKGVDLVVWDCPDYNRVLERLLTKQPKARYFKAMEYARQFSSRLIVVTSLHQRDFYGMPVVCTTFPWVNNK